MFNRIKLQHLAGETIRDIGILITVFGPLDALYQERRFGGVLLPVSLLIGGLCSIIVGIMLETREERS
jgi:hypothetical protein